MNKLILLALIFGSTSQVAWSAQKPLEITCDYYTHKTEMYRDGFLFSVTTDYGNKEEDDWESSQDYWIDLVSLKAHSSNFHDLDNVIQQGDTIVLRGENKIDNPIGNTLVETIEIKLNLRKMAGEVSLVTTENWNDPDVDSTRYHYYSLDGECRYEYNGLNWRSFSD